VVLSIGVTIGSALAQVVTPSAVPGEGRHNR